MSEVKDLEFLISIVKPFFRQVHIKKTLATIQEDKITGWEKWLQIEFASFVREHESVKAWGRESRYRLDKRMTRNKLTCSVDFILHQRNKHSHMAVEMKQVNAMTSCVGAMLRDVKKLERIKGTEYDIRSVWCLGVHKRALIEDVRREVLYYASKHAIEINEDLIVSERIGRTEYAYTVL